MERKYFNFLIMLMIGFTMTSCGGSKFTLTEEDMPDFPTNSETGKVEYVETVSLDSVSKNTLFTRTREWFAKNYYSATDVIQMEDKKTGKIIGKANVPVNMRTSLISNKDMSAGHINYTISIYFKNGKYKYEITDFQHIGGGPADSPNGGSVNDMMEMDSGFWGNPYRKTYLYYLVQLDENMKSLISDLKSALSSNNAEETQNNW